MLPRLEAVDRDLGRAMARRQGLIITGSMGSKGSTATLRTAALPGPASLLGKATALIQLIGQEDSTRTLIPVGEEGRVITTKDREAGAAMGTAPDLGLDMGTDTVLDTGHTVSKVKDRGMGMETVRFKAKAKGSTEGGSSLGLETRDGEVEAGGDEQ